MLTLNRVHMHYTPYPLPASKGNWHYYGEAALAARGTAVAIRLG